MVHHNKLSQNPFLHCEPRMITFLSEAMTITTNTHPRRPSVTFVSGITTGAPHPPVPILKNSNTSKNNIGIVDGGERERSSSNSNNNNRKRPVEFSSETSVIHSKKAEDDLDESDTDVGSHDFDAEDDSFDFGVGEDGDDGMTMTSVPPQPATAVTSNMHGSKGLAKIGMASTSSSPFISRVGAKIRRLNLNDADEANGGSSTSSGWGRIYCRSDVIKDGTNFAEEKAEAVGPVLGTDGSSAVSVSFDSPSRTSNIGSSTRSNIQYCKAAGSRNTMFGRTFRPSPSFKGSGRQRCLFADDTRHDENGLFLDTDVDNVYPGNSKEVRDQKDKITKNFDDDEISPRDVANFPSFATWESPTKMKDTSTSGGQVVVCRKNNKDLEATPCSPPPSISKRPPPTPSMKNTSKPNRRRILESIASETIQDSLMVCDTTADDDAGDADEIAVSSLPPPRATRQGLRTYGRASSFLQMFSQESLITEKNDVVATDSMEEEEDFIHKPKDDDTEKFTRSSPKSCNRNNHRRYAPSSPSSTNNDESADRTCTNPSSSFSRFLSDFEIVGTLGVGSFGSVYSVRNRTDRRLYAIKAAKREARGSSDRNRMLQEVYALSALSDKGCMNSMHIVRYHQAWMEGNRLYIQTELCDSTLLQVMRGKRVDENNDGKPCVYVDEKERYKLLREMLLALDLVHKSGMIHLDIKPENIFIKNGQYKLGDFGLVSKIENHDDVEEGDSRYMSMELLSGELDDLTKVSKFVLLPCLARKFSLLLFHSFLTIVDVQE